MHHRFALAIIAIALTPACGLSDAQVRGMVSRSYQRGFRNGQLAGEVFALNQPKDAEAALEALGEDNAQRIIADAEAADAAMQAAQAQDEIDAARTANRRRVAAAISRAGAALGSAGNAPAPAQPVDFGDSAVDRVKERQLRDAQLRYLQRQNLKP